jgi:uncharacterized protein YfdQ (DUF2303 family)
VPQDNDTVLDVIDQIGGGKSLTVSQRKLLPEIRPPQRSESPARQHVLMTPDAVIAYLQAHRTEHTAVLLDATTMSGSIVLDETADDQYEVIGFKPTKHPLLAEWEAVINKKVDVTAFAEFLLAHRRQIINPDGRTVAMIFAQVRADKTTTIHKGTGSQAINGVVVEVKLGAGSNVKSAAVELPDSITIMVPLFVGQAARDIQLDLLVCEANDKVLVLTSASGVAEAMFDEFLAMAKAIEDANVAEVVALGKVGYGEWHYLK